MEGILLQGSITILAIIVTYITTARKSAKEIKQLGANIDYITEQKENLEVDTTQKLVDFFKRETSELIDRVNTLNVRVLDLTQTVEDLKLQISNNKSEIEYYKGLLKLSQTCKIDTEQKCPIRQRMENIGDI